VLLAAFCAPLAASPQDVEYLAQLDRAERSWAAANVLAYRYTLVKGGVFGHSEYQLKVGANRCTARSRFVFDNKPKPWRYAKCDGLTMPELFAEVREQLVKGTRRVGLKLDGSLGYIVEFTAEPATNLSDQDWYVIVSEFRANTRAREKP
jgi:hypothetical protein